MDRRVSVRVGLLAALGTLMLSLVAPALSAQSVPSLRVEPTGSGVALVLDTGGASVGALEYTVHGISEGAQCEIPTTVAGLAGSCRTKERTAQFSVFAINGIRGSDAPIGLITLTPDAPTGTTLTLAVDRNGAPIDVATTAPPVVSAPAPTPIAAMDAPTVTNQPVEREVVPSAEEPIASAPSAPAAAAVASTDQAAPTVAGVSTVEPTSTELTAADPNAAAVGPVPTSAPDLQASAIEPDSLPVSAPAIAFVVSSPDDPALEPITSPAAAEPEALDDPSRAMDAAARSDQAPPRAPWVAFVGPLAGEGIEAALLADKIDQIETSAATPPVQQNVALITTADVAPLRPLVSEPYQAGASIVVAVTTFGSALIIARRRALGNRALLRRRSATR